MWTGNLFAVNIILLKSLAIGFGGLAMSAIGRLERYQSYVLMGSG